MQRQVAHALLTRPPLSCLNASRRINSNNSVRLECVMHAASVHPEPGSNSRKNYILITLRCLKSSRAIYLSFTFCLSSIFSINSDEISICTCNALYFSLVVQFSMTVLPAPSRTAWLFYHIFFLLSSTFLDFFQIFSIFLISSCLWCLFARLSRARNYIILHLIPYVKRFFTPFSTFLRLLYSIIENNHFS